MIWERGTRGEGPKSNAHYRQHMVRVRFLFLLLFHCYVRGISKKGGLHMRNWDALGWGSRATVLEVNGGNYCSIIPPKAAIKSMGFEWTLVRGDSERERADCGWLNIFLRSGERLKRRNNLVNLVKIIINCPVHGWWTCRQAKSSVRPQLHWQQIVCASDWKMQSDKREQNK